MREREILIERTLESSRITKHTGYGYGDLSVLIVSLVELTLDVDVDAGTTWAANIKQT